MDRGMSVRAPLATILLLVAGVAGARDLPTDWRRAATPADRERLRHWRDAWLAALGKARSDGSTAQIAAQGPLLDLDHALAGATPPAGNYRCRTIRLGGAGAGFVPGTWTACDVASQGVTAAFSAVSGPQRTTGTIFEDTGARSVYLGALMFGDETRRMAYGRDARRNMVGVVERIGPARWRIVLPYPGFQSTLDVIELVPAPSEPEAAGAK
jgi:hypothetical protein